MKNTLIYVACLLSLSAVTAQTGPNFDVARVITVRDNYRTISAPKVNCEKEVFVDGPASHHFGLIDEESKTPSVVKQGTDENNKPSCGVVEIVEKIPGYVVYYEYAGEIYSAVVSNLPDNYLLVVKVTVVPE